MSRHIVHSPEAAPCHTCSTPTHSIIADQHAPGSRVAKRRHCALCQIGPFVPAPNQDRTPIVRANGKPAQPKLAQQQKERRRRASFWEDMPEAERRSHVESWLERRKTETWASMEQNFCMRMKRWAHELGYEVPALHKPTHRGKSGPQKHILRGVA